MPAEARPRVSLLGKVGGGVAIAVGLYALMLGLLLQPPLQRFALYGYYFNTLWKDDLNNPEAFGFAKHQVTPFTLRTPDNKTLFAWHILLLDVYARHEKALLAEDRPHGPAEDFTQTSAFGLLMKDEPKMDHIFLAESTRPVEDERKGSNEHMDKDAEMRLRE